MSWLYLTLVYLVLAAVLYIATHDLRKSARWARLIFFGGGLLFSLFDPSGLDFRLALFFTLGIACFGGWMLVTSLLAYDDTLQERWDQVQAEGVDEGQDSLSATEAQGVSESEMERRHFTCRRCAANARVSRIVARLANSS